MKTLPLLAFMPEEVLPLLFIGAGFFFLFGARRIAGTLLTAGLLFVFLPPLLEPFLDMLPSWTLYLLLGFIWLSLFGAIASLILGKGAADQMVGSLAADLVKWVLFFPFRLMRRIFFRPRI